MVCCKVDTLIGQELDHFVFAPHARINEGRLRLLLGHASFQASVVTEETPDSIESSNSRRPYDIQLRTSFRQVNGSFRTAIRQTAKDCVLLVAGRFGMVYPRSMVQQHLQQRILYARLERMNAGCCESQGGRTTTVKVCLSIYLSAGRE